MITPARKTPRFTAFSLAAILAFPTVTALAGCGNNSGGGGGGTTASAPAPTGGPTAPVTANGQAAPQQQGMSTGKKAVIVLAGAALLYYLYKKHQQSQQQAGASGGAAGQQLYRSKNGGIYYRDPQTHKAIWVSAPTQGVAVPADQVQQYAPDYQQYQGQSGAPPAGAQTVPAQQFDPSLAGGG